VNNDKQKNLWGGLNAIDQNKNQEERKEVLKMYVE
jgi:hypothetical protein